MKDRMMFYDKTRPRERMTRTELFFADHGDKKLEAISQYDEVGFTINELYEHFRARMRFETKREVLK